MALASNALRSLVLALGMFATTLVMAHPKLLASTPADNAEVPAPSKIELRFSEALVAQFSTATLVMTGMPGMANHGEMTMAVALVPGDDAKTLVITPAQPLMPGSYRVNWRAVSKDTHNVKGKMSFKVK